VCAACSTARGRTERPLPARPAVAQELLDPRCHGARREPGPRAHRIRVVDEEARGLGAEDAAPAEDPRVGEGSAPDHGEARAGLAAHALELCVGRDPAVPAYRDRHGAHGAGDPRPVDLGAVAFGTGAAVHGEQCRAALLDGARQLLDARGVVVAGADLGGHRHVDRVGHRAHDRLQRGRIAQERRSRAARDGALRRTAEVQVDQRRARCDGVLGGAREVREIAAHQLHSHRLREARWAEVPRGDGARDRCPAHAHELGEGAAE